MAGSILTDSVVASDGLQALAGGPVDVRPGRSRLWVEALVIVWLCWLYDMLANLAPLRRAAALAHAIAVLHLERTLGVDPALALNHWLAAQHTLGLVLSDYYDNAHFVLTLGLLGWLWWRRPDLYRPLRNALVLMNLIGFAVFWLYPMAPPRMLTGLGFSDIVAATHAFGSWHTGSLAADADQYAAMPSLHMAWAAWCSVALWRLSGRWRMRAIAILHPTLTAVAVLATGNHFMLDVLAGLATAALALVLVQLLAIRLSRRPRGGGLPGVASIVPPSAPILSADGARHGATVPVSHVTKLLRSPRQGTLAGRQPQTVSQDLKGSRRERAGGPSHL